MKAGRYIGYMLLMALPTILSLMVPEHLRYSVVLMMFAGAGVTILFWGGTALIVKIILANAYSFDWQKPIPRDIASLRHISAIGRFFFLFSSLSWRANEMLFLIMAGGFFNIFLFKGATNGL